MIKDHNNQISLQHMWYEIPDCVRGLVYGSQIQPLGCLEQQQKNFSAASMPQLRGQTVRLQVLLGQQKKPERHSKTG